MESERKTVLRGLRHPVRSLAEALDDITADLARELHDPRISPPRRAEITLRLARLDGVLHTLRPAGEAGQRIFRPPWELSAAAC
jgi:hypothetical protein